MAMYSMLRRASSSALPLALRAVASRRAFHSAVSSVRSVENVGLIQRFLVPSVRFANAFATKTSADKNLLQVLETEINCAEEDDQNNAVEETPNDFPFEIEDRPGERTILLTRQYQDETIKVQVDIPNVEAEEGEDEGNDEKNHNSEYSIPFVVSISKRNGLCLEFGVTAFPDEISIDSLSIKQSEESEDQLAYEGPEFNDLDENLQKSFHKYLEVRGMNLNTTNFLQEYMLNKDSKEYLMWLKNLKSFIEN